MVFDVVYALGSGTTWQNNELKYSLRSIEKYFNNLGNVFVVGEKPEWLHNIIHIPTNDPFRNNKDGNIIRKVLFACKREELTTNFLFMNDDYVLMQAVNPGNMKAWYLSMMSDYKECWFKDNMWKLSVKRTLEYMRKHNLPVYHFDGAHCPQIYNKYTFQKVMNMVGWDGELGYTISNLYLNITRAEAGFVGPIKTTLQDGLDDINLIRKITEKTVYLSYNDIGLTSALKTFLQEKFPEPCKYEK